jgi:DNA-binding response OmpR family regulator
MDEPAGTPARVLVLEDFAQLRDLLVRGLTSAGFDAKGAGTVEQARNLGFESFDALVVDHRLGDVFGADLFHELRRKDSIAASRFILITGGIRDPGLPAEVPVLVKPFPIEGLVDAVHHVIAASS